MSDEMERTDWTADDWCEWGRGRHALLEVSRRKLAEAESRVQKLEIALTRFIAVSELPGTRAELSDETEKAKSFARAALEAARKR
jgi:hypothetical protein